MFDCPLQAYLWLYWEAAPPCHFAEQTQWHLSVALQWLWNRRHHHRLRGPQREYVCTEFLLLFIFNSFKSVYYTYIIVVVLQFSLNSRLAFVFEILHLDIQLKFRHNSIWWERCDWRMHSVVENKHQGFLGFNAYKTTKMLLFLLFVLIRIEAVKLFFRLYMLCICFSGGGRKIQNIQPFTKKDLDSAGLGDRIRDISCISYVYPDLPKDEVFKKFYTGKYTRRSVEPLSLAEG